MKVLVIALLALGAGSAARSGPYLPSGWKPAGPAFLLPSELQKPSESPLIEALQVEAEAEGSDFLREYGPPKAEEVSQDITQQDLPDVVTQQTFAEIDTNAEENSELNEQSFSASKTEEKEKSELNERSFTQTEEKSESQQSAFELKTVVDEVAVESVANDAVNEVDAQKSGENTTEENVDVTQSDVATVAVQDTTDSSEEQTERTAVEETVKESEEDNVVLSDAEERRAKSVDEEVAAEVTEVVGGVQNIADALLNLENEIKSQQVQSAEEKTEVKTVQENPGVSAPEGFLEYGPPGFSEYGPPKELLRSDVEKSDVAVETNETRRRRFSPKFRMARRAHH